MKKKARPVPQPKEKIKVAPAKKKTPNDGFFIGGILLLVLVIYSNALQNEILTFDDNEYFQNYPEVLRLSWESIKKFFTTYYVIMYQPLPVLSFAVNNYFTGLDPFPLHAVNLCFHLANTFLVYHFIKLLTDNRNIALICVLLFGIHPMNVEAVSWISARSSSMYTFFYLLSLIYYLKYLKTNSSVKYLFITGLFFILSLFSKAQAVTLPVLMLLLDYFNGRKLLSQKVILEKVPFFILSIIFGIVTLMDVKTMSNITTGMIVSYNPVDIFFIVCHSFAFYLFKLILPVNLCAVYVYPPMENGMLPWQYYASAVLMAAVVYFLFRARKNKKVILGAGIFFITIAINIQLIPSRLFEVTDRYAYFPYIGLFLIPLFYVNSLKEKSIYHYNKYLPYFILLLISFSIFFSYSIYQRNKAWQNDEVFMTDIINKNPPVPYLYRAYGNRGFYYKKTFRPALAIDDFTQALKLKPDDSRNYFNRALANLMLSDSLAAMRDFNEVEKMDPDQPVLYANRAQLKFTMRDTLGAIADCNKCLALDSSHADVYNTLANIEFARKNYAQCENVLNLAIKFNPDFNLAYKNRGVLYLQLNQKEKACADLQRATELKNTEAFQLLQQYCR